jgi:hypothetical protein
MGCGKLARLTRSMNKCDVLSCTIDKECRSFTQLIRNTYFPYSLVARSNALFCQNSLYVSPDQSVPYESKTHVIVRRRISVPRPTCDLSLDNKLQHVVTKHVVYLHVRPPQRNTLIAAQPHHVQRLMRHTCSTCQGVFIDTPSLPCSSAGHLSFRGESHGGLHLSESSDRTAIGP